MGIFGKKKENPPSTQADWPDNDNTKPVTAKTDDQPTDDAWEEEAPKESEGVHGQSQNNDENAAKVNEGSTTDDTFDLSKLIEMVKGIKTDTSSLSTLFADKIANSESDEKTIGLLHAELQKHKNDLYAQLVKPLLVDIIGVRDSIVFSLNKVDGEDAESKAAVELLQDCSEQLEYILEKYNVIAYRSSEGDTFAPLKQRIVKKVKTDDPAAHGKVADSLGFGYEYHGKSISLEKINIYNHEGNKEEK